MDKKKIIPLVIVVLLLLMAVLYFEVFRHIGKDDSEINGSGTIEVTEIDISSKLAGRVLNILKEEGEKVHKDELIVKLEYDELNAQKLSAKANLVNFSKNFSRIKRLFKTGAISKMDYDNAEAVYRVSRANFDRINASIENAVIFSPIDGIILERITEVGETAFPGTSILTIADLSKPWIKIYVNERKLGNIKLGQKARLVVDSFPGKFFSGRVVAISNKAEFTPKTIQTKDERVKLMFAVKIALKNPDLSLKPGMPADAEILPENNK